MFRSSLGTLFLASVALSPAWADAPLPKNLKYATPRVRFDDLDKHAEYAFFLKYNSGRGNPFASPPYRMELKNGEVFEMKGGRRIAGMQLFALPRDDAEKLKAKDPTLAWVNEKTEGLLKANVIQPSTTAPADTKEVPVTAYRAAIKENKLTVEILPRDQKRSEAPTENPFRLTMVGICLAASLALFGLWAVRRRGM